MSSFFDSINQIESDESTETSLDSNYFNSINQIAKTNDFSSDDVLRNYENRIESTNGIEEPAIPEEDPVVVDTSEHDDFIRGVLRGWESTKSMAGGAGALLGEMFDNEDLKNWGIDYYREHDKEAGKYKKAAFMDDPIDWIQGTLGELAPTMAQSMVGAFIGGITTGGIGSIPGALTGAAGRKVLSKSIEKLFEAKMKTNYAAKLIKDFGEKEAKARIRKSAEKAIAKSIGGKAGMVAATAQMEIGGNYGEAYDKYGDDASVTSAIATGMASALLELAGGNIRVIDKVLGADTAKVFKKAISTKDASLITRIAKEAAIQAPEEAMQESMQELMSLVNLKANDSDYEIWTKENVMRMAESAGAGLTGGLAFGSVTGLAPNPTTLEDIKKESIEHAKKTVQLTGDEVVDKKNITDAENEYMKNGIDALIAERKAKAEKKGLGLLKSKGQEASNIDNAIANSENKVRNLEKTIAAKKLKGAGLDKIVEGYVNAITELNDLKKQRGDKDSVQMKNTDQIVNENKTEKPKETKNSKEEKTLSDQEVYDKLTKGLDEKDIPEDLKNKNNTETATKETSTQEKPKTKDQILLSKVEDIYRNYTPWSEDTTGHIGHKVSASVDMEKLAYKITKGTKEYKQAWKMFFDFKKGKFYTETKDSNKNTESKPELKQQEAHIGTNEGKPIVTPIKEENVDSRHKDVPHTPIQSKQDKLSEISDVESAIEDQQDALEKAQDEGDDVAAAEINRSLLKSMAHLDELKKSTSEETTTQEAKPVALTNTEEIAKVKDQISALEKTTPVGKLKQAAKNRELKALNSKLKKLEKQNGNQTTTKAQGTKENQEAGRNGATEERDRSTSETGNLQENQEVANPAAVKISKKAEVFKVNGRNKTGKRISVDGFDGHEFIAVEDTEASKPNKPKVYDVIEAETGARIARVTGHANIKEAVASKLTSREDFEKAKKSRLKTNKENAAKEQSHEEVLKSIPEDKEIELDAIVDGETKKQKINAKQAFQILSEDYNSLTEALRSACLKG